jgi:hypothetical protein
MTLNILFIFWEALDIQKNHISNVQMHDVRNPIIINQYYYDKKEPSCSEQCLVYYNFRNLCA